MKALSVLVLAGFLLLVAACYSDDETHPGKKGEIDWIEIAETIGAGDLPEPNAERSRQREIEQAKRQETRNQAEIARLTKIIEDFDRITFKILGTEKIPGPLGDESYTGFYLTLDIGNPSSERHNSVGYLVKWQAHLVKYNIGCPVEDQAPATVTGEEEDSIYGLEPGETYQVRHRISVGSMSCAILNITVDPTPSVSVTSLDGFKSKEEVEAAITQLQTSPGN